MGSRGDIPAEKRARLYRCAAALGVAAGLVLPGGEPAWAQAQTPRIDSFGPYTLGMTLDQAKAAHPGGKAGACGDVAPDRQCLVLDAAVFEEPGRIFAVLDAAGGKVDRIVAQLDPQLTQRRAYRCVRLAEKVFALLVVVYGPKYKQSYDQNRRPLPAVAWDGEQYGRLVFESKCRNADEGNPRISLVDFVPEGGERPKIAEKPAAPPAPVAADRSLPIDTAAVRPQAPAGAEAPPPLSAPIGVVEQVRPAAEAAAAQAAQAALAQELALAKGKGPEPETPAPPPPAAQVAEPPARIEPVAARPAPEPLPATAAAVPAPPPAAAQSVSLPVQLPAPAVLPASAPSIDAAVAQRLAPPAPAPVPPQPAALAQPAVPPAPAPPPAALTQPAVPPAPQPAAAPLPVPDQARQTAALPPVRPATYTDPEDLPEPPDTVAPLPFMMPEEEAEFSRLRDAAAPAAPAPVAAAASAEPALPDAPLVHDGAARAPLSLLSSSPAARRPAEPAAAALAESRPQALPAGEPVAAPLPAAAVPAPETPAERRQARAAPEPEAAAEPAPLPEPPAPAAKRDPRRLAPVMTGGWRHAAPVPPARPWRERGPSES